MKTKAILGVAALGVFLLAADAGIREIPHVPAWRGKRSAAAQEKTFAPVLTENSIICGGKTLALSPNGRIRCLSAEGGELFNGGLHFAFIRNGKEAIGWRTKNIDFARSKFYRDGRKYIWEMWYKDHDVESFHGLSQILEVLPDGRITLSWRTSFPPNRSGLVFKPWTFVFSLPESTWLNTKANFDGTRKILSPDFKTQNSGKNAEVKWIFGEQDPAKSFTLGLRTAELGKAYINYRKSVKDYLMFFSSSGKKDYRTFTLDLRRGTDTAGKDIRGGVDFLAQENMLLPDNRHKNLIPNGSFECGLEGWHSKYFNLDEQWNWDPYALDDQVVFDGNTSLRLKVRQKLRWPSENFNFGTTDLPLEPGKYTLSFYARGEQGKKPEIHVWIPSFHGKEKWRPEGRWKFPLTSEWKRYQAAFEVKSGAPLVHFAFYCGEPSGQGFVWLDAVQLEKGGQATAFEPPPAEGRLLTSAADNFISSKEKIGGRLRITTAKPDTAGKVRITVKNFFGEILLDLKKDFKSGNDRTAELVLPLDKLPGLGVFVLKAEYTLADGSEAYDYHRYAHVEFLTGPRPLKQMFCLQYRNIARRCNFLQVLDRWRKLGVGGKHHVGTRRKHIWETYEKYGVIPYTGFMMSYQRGGKSGPGTKHFYIYDSPDVLLNLDLNDPRILVRDFHADSDGTITPEYQAKVKQAAKTVAANYPFVRLWGLGGELTCKMPNEWWAKGASDQDVSRMIAQLLKPFAEGVREGNPKAKIFPESPANMDSRGGIAEIGRVLAECNKLGVKFDIISVHPYRFSPENPDLDSDTETLLKVLDKHGYGKTPVFWPEGMLWGPFEIPQWGTRMSSWNDPPGTWWNNGMMSYDMGWTEKKSAAWFARAWLVALKYSNRIMGATSGSDNNNGAMDVMLTPYASQLIANTLCSVFGRIEFKKDVRFAPYIRTYIFEDERKCPVAAVWCHKPEVDNGSEEAPEVSADFGSSLDGVTDLMNSPRAFTPGKVRFQVNSFPLFFRGKPGTLKKMIDAFEKAEVHGNAVPQLAVSVNPVSGKTAQITFRNMVSREFIGSFRDQPIRIPAAGQTAVSIPLPSPLQPGSLVREDIPVTLLSDRGRKYDLKISFEAFTVGRVPEKASIDTLDWERLPAIRLTRNTLPGKPADGFFRLGWNRSGLFLETTVRDPDFTHVEYPRASLRWKNDCLQVFFDTFANGRRRMKDGYDEDDYDYAVFPNSKGTSSQVFRYHSVDSQLGLATQAPPDNTFAPDIPSRFLRRNDHLTYRVFFPAKYLLPMKMQPGWVFGFGLYVPDYIGKTKKNGGLTLALDGKGCFERPRFWPAAVLTE